MKNIRFRFRCSAFGVAYYDCVFLDAIGTPASVEVCFQGGFIEAHPVLSYRYDVRIDDVEILDAWRDFCRAKRVEYLNWLDEHPHAKQWICVLPPFRETMAEETILEGISDQLRGGQ